MNFNFTAGDTNDNKSNTSSSSLIDNIVVESYNINDKIPNSKTDKVPLYQGSQANQIMKGFTMFNNYQNVVRKNKGYDQSFRGNSEIIYDDSSK